MICADRPQYSLSHFFKMKIPFYSLPKEERQAILDKIELATANSKKYREELNQYRKVVDQLESLVDIEQEIIFEFRNKYDFS